MKYGDELDRVPSEGFSRRQFLSAGGSHAARLAGLFLPGGAKRLVKASGDAESSGHEEEPPDRRDN
jgi:hypothetical protein